MTLSVMSVAPGRPRAGLQPERTSGRPSETDLDSGQFMGRLAAAISGWLRSLRVSKVTEMFCNNRTAIGRLNVGLGGLLGRPEGELRTQPKGNPGRPPRPRA
jgi:hypothetical protein